VRGFDADDRRGGHPAGREHVQQRGLAQSYNLTDGSRHWSNGDYNYDGNVVDIEDQGVQGHGGIGAEVGWSGDVKSQK
jgi:hypothetical protein